MTTTPAPAASTSPAPPSGAVYSLAYKRYAGARRSPAFAPLVIARYALTTQLRQRGVKIVLLLGLMVLALTAAVMGFKWAIPTVFASAGGEAVGGDRLAAMLRAGEADVASVGLRVQFLATFLLLLWCGAGAISADLVAGAFQFHFARPVSPKGYLLGRLLSSSGWAFALSALTVSVLAIERLAFQSTPFGAARAGAVALAAVAMQVTVLASLALGLSSLTRRKGLAQAMFAAVVLATYAVCGVVGEATDVTWVGTLDPYGCVVAMVNQFHGTLRLTGARAAIPAAAAAGWTALSLGLATWQLSRAEVNRG